MGHSHCFARWDVLGMVNSLVLCGVEGAAPLQQNRSRASVLVTTDGLHHHCGLGRFWCFGVLLAYELVLGL